MRYEQLQKTSMELSSISCLMILITLVSILNLITSYFGPDLNIGTAHYALYAKYLDLSYFDHPPMVGWLEHLGIILGKSDVAMQVTPIILSALTNIVLYKFVRTLWPAKNPWIAFIAVLISQFDLPFAFSHVFYTPESPLVFFSFSNLLFFYKAYCQNKWKDWLIAGTLLGCAGLSDYNAIFLATSEIIFILAKNNKIILQPKTVVYFLIAIIIASPVFIWNSQHHFISITYQFHHGMSTEKWKPFLFLVNQLIQCGTYSPFTYFLGYFCLYQCLKKYKTIDNVYHFLLIIILSIFVFYGFFSGYSRQLCHWTILGWLCTNILIAEYLFNHYQTPLIQKIIKTGLAYNLIILFIGNSLLFYDWIPIHYPNNFSRQFTGWRQAAATAKMLSQQRHEAVFVNNWTLADRLSWYSNLPIQVAGFSPKNEQFNLWFGTPKKMENGILVVSPKTLNINYVPKTHFAQCILITTLKVHRFNKIVNLFQYYQCNDFDA